MAYKYIAEEWANPEKASWKNSCAKGWYNGVNNQPHCASKTQHASTKHANSATKPNKAS